MLVVGLKKPRSESWKFMGPCSSDIEAHTISLGVLWATSDRATVGLVEDLREDLSGRALEDFELALEEWKEERGYD